MKTNAYKLWKGGKTQKNFRPVRGDAPQYAQARKAPNAMRFARPYSTSVDAKLSKHTTLLPLALGLRAT
eukprot:6175635-Pleurochrysis_carterae.AAC.1